MILELTSSMFATFGFELEPLPFHEGSNNVGVLKILVYNNKRHRSRIPKGSQYSPGSYFSMYEEEGVLSENNGYDALLFTSPFIDACVEEIYGQSVIEFRTDPLPIVTTDEVNPAYVIDIFERVIQSIYSSFSQGISEGHKELDVTSAIGKFNDSLSEQDVEFKLVQSDGQGDFICPKDNSLLSKYILHSTEKGQVPKPLFGTHFNVSIPLGLMFSELMLDIPIYQSHPKLKNSKQQEWPSCYASSKFIQWESRLIKHIDNVISTYCENVLKVMRYSRIAGLLKTISYSFAMLVYLEH